MAIKTTLINPPQIFTKSQVASGLTPPLGIAYLASYLLSNNHEVQVIDGLGEAPDTITPFLKSSFLRGMTLDDIVKRIDPNSGLIGISNLFSFAYPAVELLSEKIHKKYPFMKIILGGPHPSALYKEILETRSEITYVAIGEGEESLSRLLTYLNGEEEIDYVTGIAMRDCNNVVVQLKSTKRFKDLNKENIPFPARHLLPMETYIQGQESHGPASGRWTSMLSSRGCPYGCTFCESAKTLWVARSAKDVVDEMEHLLDKYGVSEFHFEDDNMTINRNRLIGICDEILKRELKIKWQTPNGIRASITDDEMLKKMKESGCMHITLAPESGSERVLTDIIDKGRDFSLDQLLECGRAAHKIGLKVAAYFIIGLPGETREDMVETVKYAKALARAGVDEAAFSLFIPLPGTPLWDVVKEKRKNMDFIDLLAAGDLNRAISWNDWMDENELKNFRLRAYITFQITRMIYHPIAFLKSFFNVLRDIEETKTERTLRQILARLKIKKKKFTNRSSPEFDNTQVAYPYDTKSTFKIIFQNKPHYAFGHSLLQAFRLFGKKSSPPKGTKEN